MKMFNPMMWGNCPIHTKKQADESGLCSYCRKALLSMIRRGEPLPPPGTLKREALRAASDAWVQGYPRLLELRALDGVAIAPPHRHTWTQLPPAPPAPPAPPCPAPVAGDLDREIAELEARLQLLRRQRDVEQAAAALQPAIQGWSVPVALLRYPEFAQLAKAIAVAKSELARGSFVERGSG